MKFREPSFIFTLRLPPARQHRVALALEADAGGRQSVRGEVALAVAPERVDIHEADGIAQPERLAAVPLERCCTQLS